MIEPSGPPRTPPVSPALALRIATLGIIGFVLFAVVFFRLWYLQVLSGEDYLRQAQVNRVRAEVTPAPRGAIVDRNDAVLVRNRVGNVLRISPQKLPQSERDLAAEWGQEAGERERKPKGQRGDPVPIPPIPAELRDDLIALGKLIDVPAREIQEELVTELAQVPYSPVTIKTDVPESLRVFVRERQQRYPLVEVADSYLRDYPRGRTAAQLVGVVNEISERQLEQERFRGVQQGTLIGQEGLEARFDEFLRGRDGQVRRLVDANGQSRGIGREIDATSGQTVKLTLDLKLQEVGERALVRAGGGKPGAFVALDPRNGEVLALGSYPTFDPAELAKPISQERYDTLFSEEAGAPRINRATSAAYSVGSTFKVFTAFAGVDEGLVTPTTQVPDPGCIQIAPGPAGRRCNAGDKPNGNVDLRKAMTVSSDTYFYRLGLALDAKRGQPLQSWARRLGLERTTGIDLPNESKGVVPDRKWREALNAEQRACVKKFGRGSCFLSDGREWSPGDNVNLSIGQGDLQATLLQLAVAYGAIENGGKLVEPHLGKQVEDEQGRLLQRLPKAARKRVDLDPATLQAIRDGLRGAAQSPEGTSTAVWADWDHGRYPVFGKTGTAERQPRADSSFYVCYVPDAKRPIVVATTVEGGGFGAETAAPVARQLVSQHFLKRPGPLTSGKVDD